MYKFKNAFSPFWVHVVFRLETGVETYTHYILYSILQIRVDVLNRCGLDAIALLSDSPPPHKRYARRNHQETRGARWQPDAAAVSQLFVFHHFVRMFVIFVCNRRW